MPSCGRDNNGPSNASSKLPAQLHHTSWDPKPFPVLLFHITKMLTCEDLLLLQGTLQALLEHLSERGWTVNSQKIPGPGTDINFFGVIWLGKMCNITESVIDKVQAHLPSQSIEEVQSFVGTFRFWSMFVLPLAQ